MTDHYRHDHSQPEQVADGEAEGQRNPPVYSVSSSDPLPPFRGQEGTSGRVQCSDRGKRLAMRVVQRKKSPTNAFSIRLDLRPTEGAGRAMPATVTPPAGRF